ncbi:EAL domain-containing protein [Maricaulis maris]|uniref:EAL domain-containing protein (Putative c-di-GMP-specific phosphodiesterase class I) n=1 Tax=Maricaulis maris TaxID=74318 RepID=A0A495CVU6_9PROT|nr:EAL domain-containing protein [Maricaulis maris]RKQ89499.1 EAL domain-containing protein (putative c-di-GMP-specific phosphodiesterase class I) [Maricaulis maris]
MRLPASPLAIVAVVLSLVLALVPSAVRAQDAERLQTVSEAVDAARSVMMADPTAALSLAERAEVLADRLTNSERDEALATAEWLQSEALTRMGRAEDAHPHALEALGRLGEAPAETKLLADIFTSLGRIEKVLGEHGEALEHYQSAYEIYRDLGESRSEAIGLQSMASIYSDARQYERAVEYFRNALDRYQDPALDLAAHNNLANALTQLGRYDEAAASYAQARTLANAMDSAILEARVLNNLANLQLELADYDGADASIDAAFSMVADDGTFEWVRFFWGVRAQIAYGRGDPQGAVRFLGVAFRDVEIATTSQNFMELHGSAAEIYAAHGDWGLAYDHLQAFKRLTDERAAFASSANSALVGAQFDFTEQELEIQQLRAEGLEQALELARARQARNMMIASGIGVLCLFIAGIVFARSRVARAKARALSDSLYTDASTGLPTHAAMLRDLTEITAKTGKVPVVIAVQIKRRKHLSGALGYRVYSRFEQAVADRLAGGNYPVTVYRLLPGLFGLLQPSADTREACAVARDVTGLFETAVQVDDLNIDVGIICGLAQGDDAETAIRQAHLAIDQARSLNQSHAEFDPDLYGNPAANLSLMSEMMRATEKGEMALYYQPKLNVRTGRFESVEALSRWFHPERGFIPPDQFIPQAEETGHIRPFTEWVLRQSVEDQKRLLADGKPMSIAINISGALVGDADFARKARAMIVGARGPITLEITETAVMTNPDKAIEHLKAWRDAGARISIDDYGTGQSSLAYLQMIPSDELKLDRQFVSNLNANARGRMLIKSTIDLAHNLGLEVVAEGVETETDLAALKLLGSDWIQGYYLSKPVPIAELETFLAAPDQEVLRARSL